MNRLIPLSLSVLLAMACGQAAEPVAERPVRQVAFATAGSSATDLGTLGGNTSYAADINNPGVVVGYSETATGAVHAFRWTATGGMTDLGTLPGGRQSGAIRILNSGKILGWSETAAGKQLNVQWSASGQIQALDIAPIREVFSMDASDFNERGEVVGNSFNGFEHGWYWSRKTGTVDLRDQVPSCFENGAGAINASGLVAGTYCAPNAGWLHPFIWSVRAPYLDLGVGDDIYNANGAGLAINDAGTVAGWLDPHGNVYPNAAIWKKGSGYVLLPNLASAYASGYATSVNNRGVAVGASWDEAADGYVPTAWPSANTLVRLDRGSPQFALATAINDGGIIVGWGSNGSPNRALLWKLSDGKPATAVSPGGAGAIAGAIPARGATTGPASCLSDRKAMASKAALVECVMGRR